MQRIISFRLFLAISALLTGPLHADVDGWLHWRGPSQRGISTETNLPEHVTLGGANHLWTADLSGRSTPVIAGHRLYVLGHEGEGPDLQEMIVCFNARTGERLWDRRFNDFLSDIIYTRYSTSNPTIDPETGNVFVQGTQGIIAGFTPSGDLLWDHSMMELYGRMTFPNGRTASPVIDRELVITHHITANWGANGPARDRFYAFDKRTGELVWFSTPGGQPKDSSYAPPVLGWYQGKRVFYCGTGDGAVVCVNARTGDPLWRVKLSQGGINTSVLIHNDDKVIAVHGSENIDNSEIGRMVAVRIPDSIPATEPGQPHVFEMAELELWRNSISSFTSSPILVGDRIFETDETGNLCAVNAFNGEILWKKKIGIEQRNSSLVYADGKLYVPMLEDPKTKESGAEAGSKGAFYIIRPGETDAEILTHLQLDGRCFGSPAVWDGKIYLQTTRKLYCFGGKGGGKQLGRTSEPWPEPGPVAQLQPIPAEVLLKPGDRQTFRVRALDANGFTVSEIKDAGKLRWESYIPPTAKVRVRMDAAFNPRGELVASTENAPSAGAYRVSYGDAVGYIRGRVLPALPFEEDFESFEVTVEHATEPDTRFAYPPLPWIGARFKFEVRERDGAKVLTKTIDNKLFQRGIVFLGNPEYSNYTVSADLLTDGNRRKMSEVGLINQRYYIILKGNSQQLEINSNLERIRESVPFPVRPNVWYRMKTRVDVAADGSGVIRGKVWPREESEPAAWTIEVPHRNAHRNGSPGLFGFAPQEMRVYIDNISVTPNP